MDSKSWNSSLSATFISGFRGGGKWTDLMRSIILKFRTNGAAMPYAEFSGSSVLECMQDRMAHLKDKGAWLIGILPSFLRSLLCMTYSAQTGW